MLANSVEALKNLPEDGELAATAKLMAQVFFEAAVGSDEEGPGLILTAEQIVGFEVYEHFALALPGDLKGTQDYLGYDRDKGEGLEPEDFLVLFTLLRTHAGRWNPLVRDIKHTATSLESFAGSMSRAQENVEKEIARIGISSADASGVPRTLGELLATHPEFDASQFPGLVLDADTLGAAKIELADILKTMNDHVGKRHSETAAIKKRLTDYSDVLNITIRPAITLKKEMIKGRQSSGDVEVISQRIEARQLLIKQADTAYKAGVTGSVKSLSQGQLIGSIVTGIFADPHRIERNKLMEQQDTDFMLLAAEENIQVSMRALLLKFQNLEMVALDARTATENLLTVWNNITAFATESLHASKSFDDAQTLSHFNRTLKEVCEPWLTIQKNSSLLLKVFAKADELSKHKFNAR